MAASFDINLSAGTDFYHQFHLTGANGNFINLTNYLVSGQARQTYGMSGVLLDLNPMRVATGLANGVVDISITGGLTTGLASNQGVYDIQLIDSSTQKSKTIAVEGYININPSIRF
tara:strand:+ start:53 stop:400 length:348 start_codon:yes stop_codon:yes gene_type:complete